jgi:hypothetical protein
MDVCSQVSHAELCECKEADTCSAARRAAVIQEVMRVHHRDDSMRRAGLARIGTLWWGTQGHGDYGHVGGYRCDLGRACVHMSLPGRGHRPGGGMLMPGEHAGWVYERPATPVAETAKCAICGGRGSPTRCHVRASGRSHCVKHRQW